MKIETKKMIDSLIDQEIITADGIEKKSGPSSVLLVDDNAKNLQVLGGLLQNEGLSVEFALDGSNSLDEFRVQPQSAILLANPQKGMESPDLAKGLEILDNRSLVEPQSTVYNSRIEVNGKMVGFDSMKRE